MLWTPEITVQNAAHGYVLLMYPLQGSHLFAGDL